MTAVGGTSVDIPTSDGVADAYLTHPDDGAAHPGVLFFTDAPGLRAWTREMADRLASNGLHDTGPQRVLPCQASPVGLPARPGRTGGRATVLRGGRHAAGRWTDSGHCHARRRHVSGLAGDFQARDGRSDGIDGVLHGRGADAEGRRRLPGFHGGFLATEAPDSPHLAAGTVTSELYFGHADQDDTLPPEQIERLNKALDGAGVRYRAEVYAGAFHGYTQADFAKFGRFNAEATERHWRELVPLFDRTLCKAIALRTTHIRN